MRTRSLAVAALVISAVLAVPAQATEIVFTTDGSTYHGEVVEVSESAVVMDADWPPLGRVTLERSRIEDRSWWRLRTQRLGEDWEKRLALAEWAEERGLFVQAVIEFKRVREDADLRDRATTSIQRIERRLALELLDRGESLLADARPSAARRYYEIIVRRYPATDVAPMARSRLTAIEEAAERERRRLRAAREEARELRAFRRDAAAWDAELKAIRLLMEKAEELGSAVTAHTRTVRDSRRVRDQAKHLEKAWRQVTALGPPPDGVDCDDVDRVRSLVKERLVTAYLRLGEGELVRGSIVRAEEWCVRACELDPEGRENHDLHEKIIDAFLLSGTYRHGLVR